jgi:hypothetical protein
MTDEQTPQPPSITGEFLGSLPWASPGQAVRQFPRQQGFRPYYEVQLQKNMRCI